MTDYSLPPRRRNTSARQSYNHHVAWGIVCGILLSAVIGLIAYSQTLDRSNAALQRQLIAEVSSDTTCRVTGKWEPNSSKKILLQSGTSQRHFLVHTPANFIDGKYYPLVFVYPGKGASAEVAKSAFGLDELPAIVVYPAPTVGKDGFYAWQGAPYASEADDIAFTSAILDNVNARLCIDKTRSYAVGWSNGGGFTALLSCKLSDRFAAFAVVAGALYYPDGACRPQMPSSLITIHGDKDPVVPYDGSPIRKLPPISTWASMRAQMLGCNRPKTSRTDPFAVTTEWRKCDGGVVIRNVRLTGGGHMWGQIPNERLWEFLSQFSR